MIKAMRQHSSHITCDREGRRHPVSIGITVILVQLITTVSLFAQDMLFQQSEPAEDGGQAVYVTTHGLGRYRPGKWGTLRIDATNRAAKPAVVESVTWVEGSTDEQFGRAVWLPPESRRLTWQPVLTPLQKSTKDFPELYWVSVRNEGSREVLSGSVNQDRIESRALNLTSGNPVFAIISDGTNEHSAISGLLTYSLEQVRSQAKVINIADGQMPVAPEALDAADYLVVMGDRLSQNAAAVEAVQDWVRQGGKIWLMLDTMSADSAQIICGGDLQVHEMDRTSLTAYSLTSISRAGTHASDTVELERPVKLVRALAENVTVLCTVNSWPAIVVAPFGRGRVVSSMVSLRGVFVPHASLQSKNVGTLDRQLWMTTAGQDLISALDASDSEVPLDDETMANYVIGRVGYRVPVRSSGSLVLVLFCAALVTVCVAVYRYQRPLWLVPGIMVVSVLTVSAFLILASSSRTTTDSTVTFQMVEASGVQDQLQVTGVTAFHSHDSIQPQIQSTAGGMMRFDGAVGAGVPARMRWTDQDVWQLKNATLASGVRLATFRQSVDVQQPIVVKGTFNESGFHGQAHGDIDRVWSDVLLADQTAFALPASIDSEGRVLPSESGPLPPGQYLATTVLNAEQSRRLNVYRHIFDVSRRRRMFPERPMLFAWTDPLKLSTGPADQGSLSGAMLISIPIVIERPERGSLVRIPATFLPYRSVSDREDKIGAASNFSNTRRTWSASSTPRASTSRLRFQIPAALLPMAVDNAHLKVQISAPLREVTISSGRLDVPTAVWNKNSPVGTFEIPLTVESSRQLDADGGLHVSLEVGGVQLDQLEQSEVGTQDRNWLVDSMQLEIEGQIQ